MRTRAEKRFKVPHGKTPDELSKRRQQTPWKLFRVWIRPFTVPMADKEGNQVFGNYCKRPFEINVSGEIILPSEKTPNKLVDGENEVPFDDGSVAVQIKRVMTPGARLKHLLRRIGYYSVADFFKYLRKNLFKISDKNADCIEIWV